MNCIDIEERLDAYLDGELPSREVGELEMHLAHCTACSNCLYRTRDLLLQAAALPHARQPARDLWPGILARLQASSRAPSSRHGAATLSRSPWFRALAASVLLVSVFVGDMLADRVMRDGEDDLQPRLIERDSRQALPGIKEARRLLPASHVELIEGEGGLGGGSGVNSGTEQELLRNLLLVNLAIREIETAAMEDPNNASLRELLGSLYAQENRILGQAERLRATRQVSTRTGI